MTYFLEPECVVPSFIIITCTLAAELISSRNNADTPFGVIVSLQEVVPTVTGTGVIVK
jgi:hypothetical protein